jgi:hypothetical protein
MQQSHEGVLVEPFLEDVVDLGQYAKDNRKPPKARRYRIRIDKKVFEVGAQIMTGRELLILAGKQPPEMYMIFQKMRGGQAQRIELEEKADFTAPGVERFMTLPLDQTEG